jgi:hypothetical protein
VVRKNRHSRVPQRREDRVGEGSVTELEANLGMKKDIDRRDNAQVGEARRANPRALPLIYDGEGPAFGGVCNRRRLTVVEGFLGMSYDKRFKVLPAGVAEEDDFNVPCSNEVLKGICMRVSLLPARVEFTRNDVNHQNPVRHGCDDRWRAAGSNEVDNGAAIGNQWNERVS